MMRRKIYVAMHNSRVYMEFSAFRSICPNEEMEMSKKTKLEMTNEIPAEVTAFAQKSVDQAQAAFEKANEFAHSNVQVFDAAASAYKSRFADLQLRAMEIAQINVNSGFAFARKLLGAKELGEAMNMQQEFIREQSEAMRRQASELNELTVALAKETIKPMQEGFSKSFGEFTKVLAA
jgi:phasin